VLNFALEANYFIYMKKLYIKKGGLRIRRASYALDKPGILRAVKLTEAEAFAADIPTNFDEALSKFGNNRRLAFGEAYDGYLAVWHLGFPEINYLNGTLTLETEEAIFNLFLNDLIKAKRYMRVDGILDYVWVFNSCSSEMKDSVKAKITKAMVSSEEFVRLDDIETNNLRRYLGRYFDRFFAEI